jgi:hypothetical protein
MEGWVILLHGSTQSLAALIPENVNGTGGDLSPDR